MLERLRFYLLHAIRNMRRGGRWSTFAIFSIAAGVATVVALRSLGLAIGDSLLTNVRETNGGDIRVYTQAPFGAFDFGLQDSDVFSERDIERAEAWAQEHNASWTAYARALTLQVAKVDETTFGRPTFISSIFIDPQHYPIVGELVVEEPAGVPLSELLTGGYTIAISRNLADAQGIQVGDKVRVSRTEEPFTVVAIVPTFAEANLRNPFAAFFGFAYLSYESAPLLEIEYEPNEIAFVLPEGTPQQQIIEFGEELERLLRARATTAPEVLQQNEIAAQLIGDFIVVMGLGSLLIGGVGIMNTMLVMVRRRTNEIAAMKTFGMKGKQIAMMFFVEALLLGLLGSILGSVIGVLLGGVVNTFGETFLNQNLVWRIYPEALAYGAVLGLVTTAIFGLSPVLTAVKVRPGIILRPNETHIPRLGAIQSLLTLVVMIIAMGLVVGQILSPSFSLIGGDISEMRRDRFDISFCVREQTEETVPVTIANESSYDIVAYTYNSNCERDQFTLIEPRNEVTFTSQTPAYWIVELAEGETDAPPARPINRVYVLPPSETTATDGATGGIRVPVSNSEVANVISLTRSLSSFTTPSPHLVGIIGVAVTMLVLFILIGLLWVLLWFVGKFPSFGSVNLRLALRNLSTQRLRTATTMLALSAGMFALSSITFVGEGVREFLQFQLSDAFGGNVLVFPIPGAVGDLQMGAVNSVLQDVPVRYRTRLSFDNLNVIAIDGQRIDRFDPMSNMGVQIRETDNPAASGGTVIAGRGLTPEDRGQPVMVLTWDEVTQASGVRLNSVLTVETNDGTQLDLQVIGFVQLNGGLGSGPSNNAFIPPDVLPPSDDGFSLFAFAVDSEHVNEALVQLSSVPFLFALDVGFIDSFIKRILDQFTAVPTVVGILGLVAAAVIMVNTMALATLERQRQIGILKAIGLKGGRILRIMLIEAAIISLLAAFLGIGLSSIIISIFTSVSGTPIPLPTNAQPIAIGLVIAAIVISWLATSLSAGVAIRERVM
ncbi:MAG: FtsX-like permease family protein, partial [Chloroflexi bacterium]